MPVREDIIDPRDQLHRFHGGLVLPGRREAVASRPVQAAGIPPRLVLPLKQHIGEPAECLVRPGDRVFKGQMIAAPRGAISMPVHASSSGSVIAVEERPIPHPSGLMAPCIVIETDGRDEWGQANAPLADYRQVPVGRLLERIREAGIVGLGGAGFPTQVKLAHGSPAGIDLLVINGVECEPYICCDDRLMQERSGEVLEGVRILQHILRPRHCIIAIEDHMPAAEAAMRAAVGAAAAGNLRVVRVPEIYPTGGERQLIKVLTGREVPSQGFPADIGIICQNVGTAAAVCRAVVHDRPLISRIVTVTGAGVREPRNLEVLLGTPFRHAVETCGGYSSDVDRLLMGGPMMGFAVATDEVPVIKTTNCILAVTREEMPPPAPPCPAYAAASAPRYAPPICCRSNSTGMRAAATWMPRRTTTCSTASNAVAAPMYARATFRWCSTTATPRRKSGPRRNRKRRRTSPAAATRRVSRAWNASGRNARGGSRSAKNRSPGQPIRRPTPSRRSSRPHWSASGRKKRKPTRRRKTRTISPPSRNG